MAVLHAHVGRLAAGVDAADYYPGLASHIAGCGSCAKDAHGQLAAVRDDDLHI
jgi:hypothetical protein